MDAVQDLDDTYVGAADAKRVREQADLIFPIPFPTFVSEPFVFAAVCTSSLGLLVVLMPLWMSIAVCQAFLLIYVLAALSPMVIFDVALHACLLPTMENTYH